MNEDDELMLLLENLGSPGSSTYDAPTDYMISSTLAGVHYEASMRRLAKRKGFRLVKSRVRQTALPSGYFQLTNLQYGGAVFSGPEYKLGAPLEVIEAFLLGINSV